MMRPVSLRKVWNAPVRVDTQAGWEGCCHDRPFRPGAPVRQGPKPSRTPIRPKEPSPDRSLARRERVEHIRLAIANGSYHVSSADLAQKLIDRISRS